MSNTLLALLTQVFEIVVGLLGIISFHNKFSRQGNNMSDLIKQLEEKDRVIEQLKIEKHAWQMRHKHLEKAKS